MTDLKKDLPQRLLSCPFCGGEAALNSVRYCDETRKFQKWTQEEYYGVNCVQCGAKTSTIRGEEKEEEAAAVWNRRAHSPAEKEDQDWNIRKYIDFLRADEGDSVTILCDNPDFNGQPNCAIECNGYWTNWEDRRYAGDTIEAALELAYFECRQWRENPPPDISPDPRSQPVTKLIDPIDCAATRGAKKQAMEEHASMLIPAAGEQPDWQYEAGLYHSLYELWKKRADEAIAQVEQLKSALEFYRLEAAAICKNMADGKHGDALLASLTVLSLDGGKRAREAVTSTERDRA